MLKRVKVYLRGKFKPNYKYDVRDAALQLGVTGYIKESDNSVEALFEGSPDNVALLIRYAVNGLGDVEYMEIREIEDGARERGDFEVVF